jgi:hypothetical protein
MTLRADELAHSDEDELDRRLWERLTRPIPDGAIAGDAAEWDSIIFEIAEALEPGTARAPGRHARRSVVDLPADATAPDIGRTAADESAP